MRKRQRKVKDPLLFSLIEALSEDRVTDGASRDAYTARMVRLWKEVALGSYAFQKTLQK